MDKLHHYGLVRFSKKTGKIDKTLTALGKGMIQLWALQNTTKTKACVLVDIDDRVVISEFCGTADGFPNIRKDPADFEFDLPNGFWDIF